MEPQPRIKGRKGPEWIIQQAVIKLFRGHDWFVKSTHGNEYQSGFPDLFLAHRSYGTRWVECKNPEKYAFTPAQMEFFPQFAGAGVGIWIVTAATEDQYRMVVKSPPNWHMFLPMWKTHRA